MLSYVIMWGNVIMGSNCYQVVALWYHVEQILSRGSKYYHMGPNAFMWDQLLSCSYHLVLSCDVIMLDDNTPLFVIPENWTLSFHRWRKDKTLRLEKEIYYPTCVYWDAIFGSRQNDIRVWTLNKIMRKNVAFWKCSSSVLKKKSLAGF